MIEIQEAIQIVDETRRDAILVSTMSGMAFLGSQHRDRDLRIRGLMGAAASVGLGIALAKPDRPVWVLDGDGSLLMQLGVLCAVADSAPRNFTHIVLANGIYAISGAQPIPGEPDWEATALACGYRHAIVCGEGPTLRLALSTSTDGPRMVVVKSPARTPMYPPDGFSFDGPGEALRIRASLVESGA